MVEEQKAYRRMTQRTLSTPEDVKHVSPVINLRYKDENQQWSFNKDNWSEITEPKTP